jgi:membrane protease YdiL (CAAX protease family)
VLPLDPDTFRHWLGLVALVWFTLMPIASLPLLGGRPPLQALVERQGGLEGGALPAWYDLLYGLGWTVVLCLGAVGYPAWASLRAALVRLGLTWPGWRPVLAGVVLSVLMVPVFLGLDFLTARVIEALGLAPTSSAWIEQLFGREFGVSGALAAALSAGLGEELIWRGVIQPRYGLLPAALGFAAMHGFQYGPDGLISVLCAGVILGVVRQRSNTTVAAVVHGGYDLWLLLGTLLHWW